MLSYFAHHKRAPRAIERGRLASHELTLVISGGMTYIVDGVRYDLVGKSAIFIPALTERERVATDEECDYVSFNFTSEAPALPTVIENACRSEVMLLISALDRIGEKPQLNLYARGAEVLEVIISLLEEYKKAESMSALTLDILKFIHAGYKSRITLRSVADAFFFSAGYCESVFSQDMGRSIIDYVLELRVTEAQRLMLESSAALTEIAELVGFADYNYFSRVFKKRTGYTPTAYRKQIRPYKDYL